MMSLVHRILPNYTYEDYSKWEGRWEVIDGIPYAMSPAPSPKHQLIANEIGRLFSEALEAKKCHCKVYQPIDIKIKENTIVEPDLLVVCKPIKKQYLDFPPDLVVEILSDSTRLKDIHTKYQLYQDFGIKYYIIIDPDDSTIKVFRLNQKNAYEMMVHPPFEFEINSTCKISPDLLKALA
jgi:Uma2 family endonuclease